MGGRPQRRGATQHRCWPVLVGPAPRRDLVLASPVILYDYPGRRPGERRRLLRRHRDRRDADPAGADDDRRREGRGPGHRSTGGGDHRPLRHDGRRDDGVAARRRPARAPAVDPLDPTPGVERPGPGVGARRRRARRARAAGSCCTRAGGPMPTTSSSSAGSATVAEIVHDVDGEVHVAVTIDDDPGADLWEWQRRYLYFAPDEVEMSRSRAWLIGCSSPASATSSTATTASARPWSASCSPGRCPTGARVVDYGIRGVHLAFDLADGDRDADPRRHRARRRRRTRARWPCIEVPEGAFGTATFDAHDLDPNAVFRSLGALGDELPRTLVVGCQPVSMDDGIGLSDAVAAAVPVAAGKVLELLRQELEEPDELHQARRRRAQGLRQRDRRDPQGHQALPRR